MDFVRDNPSEPVPEETFTHYRLNYKVQNLKIQNLAMKFYEKCKIYFYIHIAVLVCDMW